ncbi:MAG: hypothetical protein WBV82_30740, partial [Myxococcaceae bacterium]
RSYLLSASALLASACATSTPSSALATPAEAAAPAEEPCRAARLEFDQIAANCRVASFAHSPAPEGAVHIEVTPSQLEAASGEKLAYDVTWTNSSDGDVWLRFDTCFLLESKATQGGERVDLVYETGGGGIIGKICPGDRATLEVGLRPGGKLVHRAEYETLRKYLRSEEGGGGLGRPMKVHRTEPLAPGSYELQVLIPAGTGTMHVKRPVPLEVREATADTR